jgi:molybdopterin/thiamine biosynthesis adenylyltransferase
MVVLNRVARVRPQTSYPQFDYATAFNRNLGWLTEGEQERLRHKRVAIAGMGGVGGYYLTTLARLGVQKFHIADLDQFELANFNRQAGAFISTIGRPKVDVLAEMAWDINPDSQINVFSTASRERISNGFSAESTCIWTGLDAFAFEAREMVFAYCAKRGIPAITVAPLGMSAALMNFMPGGMTFEEYFQLEGCCELEKSIRFLVGFAPSLLHRRYLVDRTRVKLRERMGPSTGLACQLCTESPAVKRSKFCWDGGRCFPRLTPFNSTRIETSSRIPGDLAATVIR